MPVPINIMMERNFAHEIAFHIIAVNSHCNFEPEVLYLSTMIRACWREYNSTDLNLLL